LSDEDVVIEFNSSNADEHVHSASVSGCSRTTKQAEVNVEESYEFNTPVEQIELAIPTRGRWTSNSSNVSEGHHKENVQLHACEPVCMEKAILNPDEFSKPKADLTNHIILCLFANKNSPEPGLDSFLKPLRNKKIPQESIKSVVIICEKEFIEKEWPIICNIPKVYVVVGSPLLWANLRAAKVMDCSVCVIVSVLPTTAGHESAIYDKEAILCSLSIQKKLKHVKKKVLIITDLRQESNVQFLDFGDEDTPDERIYKAQPFACGEAFSATMFDSVTSSVFHGPGTLYLVEDLIHSFGTSSDCQLVSKPIHGTEYVNKTYKEFYNAQLNESNVCLGISRKLSCSHRSQSFVITSACGKLAQGPYPPHG